MTNPIDKTKEAIETCEAMATELSLCPMLDQCIPTHRHRKHEAALRHLISVARATRWHSISTVDDLPQMPMATYLTTKTGSVEEIHFWGDEASVGYFMKNGKAWQPKLKPEPFTPPEDEV